MSCRKDQVTVASWAWISCPRLIRISRCSAPTVLIYASCPSASTSRDPVELGDASGSRLGSDRRRAVLADVEGRYRVLELFAEAGEIADRFGGLTRARGGGSRG